MHLEREGIFMEDTAWYVYEWSSTILVSNTVLWPSPNLMKILVNCSLGLECI